MEIPRVSILQIGACHATYFQMKTVTLAFSAQKCPRSLAIGLHGRQFERTKF